MKALFLSLCMGFVAGAACVASEIVAEAEPDALLPDWESLKDLGNVEPAVVAADGSATREEVAAAYLARAEHLRDFHTRQPGHETAKEARALEALALVRAGWAGDMSQEARREQLVAEVRGDVAIPMPLRSMVAAGLENLKVHQAGLSREERLSAFEAAVRRLIPEFGDPIAYESLFAIARSQSEEKAVSVARELLESPAPAAVKQRAEALLKRHAFVGRPIAEQLAGADADARSAFDQLAGQPAVVFAWSTGSPGSIAMAKKLSQELPGEVGMIGVNLDLDLSAAIAAADAARLRGVQLFDPDGPDGATASALALDIAPLVMVVTPSGVVESVAAHRDLSKTIQGLSTP